MYLEKRKVIIKICLIMVLIFEFVRALEDHKINLKIGFDLIPSADGSPSVRIRDFEDFNLRKFGRRKAKSSISVRAEDSSSEVEENKENEKEDKESDVDTAQSSDSDDRALRSTRGINPDEFEPEHTSKVKLDLFAPDKSYFPKHLESGHSVSIDRTYEQILDIIIEESRRILNQKRDKKLRGSAKYMI